MIAVCVILCASSSKYFPQLFFFTLSLNNLFDFNLFHFSKYKADPLFVTCRNGSSPTYLLIERLLVSFFIQKKGMAKTSTFLLYLTASCGTFFVLKTVSHPEVLWARLNNGKQFTHPCLGVLFILPLSRKRPVCLTRGLSVQPVPKSPLLRDHKYVTILNLGFP